MAGTTAKQAGEAGQGPHAEGTTSLLLRMLSQDSTCSAEAPGTPSFGELTRLGFQQQQDGHQDELYSRLLRDLVLLTQSEGGSQDPLMGSMLHTAEQLTHQLRLLAAIRFAQKGVRDGIQQPVGHLDGDARLAWSLKSQQKLNSKTGQDAAAQLAWRQLIRVVELAASRVAAEPGDIGTRQVDQVRLHSLPLRHCLSVPLSGVVHHALFPSLGVDMKTL
jgi:hypothetical protein